MRRLLLTLALAILAVPASAACVTRRVADLPLTLWQDKLLVNVTLDGSPETMALDTGAGITVISTEAAGRLDIPHDFDHAANVGGVGGAQSTLFIAHVDRLDLGSMRFGHQALPIVDLPMRDSQRRPVAGLLGADILSRFDVDLDIPGGRLGLWQETGCDTAPPPWDETAQPAPIELDAGHHIQLPLRVDGVALNAVLDTGAGGMVLTLRAGMRAGATEDALAADPVIHGTGVNNQPWSGHMHRFHSITFADRRLSDVWTALVPGRDVARYDALIGADGLVGMRVLRDMRLWISYRTKRLYVAPATRD
jgi:predicted aspartyl protease